MIFTSFLFLFIFLPIFLFVYYITPEKWRNITAVIGSYFFYAWGAPKFVFVLMLLSAVDYIASQYIRKESIGQKQKKMIFISAICFNIFFLFYFKYTNFFIDQVNHILSISGGGHIDWSDVVLPVGISFFTFHKISYLVDVYRGTASVAPTFLTYLLYIALFPQLIAGPIIRYHDIADQIMNRVYSSETFFYGIIRFSIGLAKKVLIANYVGQIADAVYGLPLGDATFLYAWLGAIAYTCQIYFDFSGYSDMAIGLAAMLGFRFMENFNYPYIATSFTDFWRRWHISLSRWMKEYVYVPLGGNRVSVARGYVNLWIVFLLSGLWHGANWTFVLWGVYHGFFLILDKIFWVKYTEHFPKYITVPLTFLGVLFGWVLFRAPSLDAALYYIGTMLDVSSISHTVSFHLWSDLFNMRSLSMLILGICIMFLPIFYQGTFFTIESGNRKKIFFQSAVCTAMVFLGVMSLMNSTFNPFIYFRF